MAIFLNTDKLNEWIPKLISETEKELIIIVPYIKASNKIYEQLFSANSRGVETILVYRENKLSKDEKNRFEILDNLNLMHHPNVHCKCYYNEKYLLMTSMNMYEYSEKNNREMGVLFHRNEISENLYSSGGDSWFIFEEAIKEIKDIINSAYLEKQSRDTIEDGFEFALLKTGKEEVEEECIVINKAFVHKRFEATKNYDKWHPVCHHYFDKINVTIKGRIELDITMPEERVLEIYNKFKPHYNEYGIEGFKYYWGYYKSSITLYVNTKHIMWHGEKSGKEKYQLYKRGLDELIGILKKFI